MKYLYSRDQQQAHAQFLVEVGAVAPGVRRHRRRVAAPSGRKRNKK